MGNHQKHVSGVILILNVNNRSSRIAHGVISLTGHLEAIGLTAAPRLCGNHFAINTSDFHPQSEIQSTEVSPVYALSGSMCLTNSRSNRSIDRNID